MNEKNRNEFINSLSEHIAKEVISRLDRPHFSAETKKTEQCGGGVGGSTSYACDAGKFTCEGKDFRCLGEKFKCETKFKG